MDDRALLWRELALEIILPMVASALPAEMMYMIQQTSCLVVVRHAIL